MKVGILTFHYGYNFGGVLQAYALQQYLASLNYRVEIINYVPKDYNITLFYGISKREPFKAIKKMIAHTLHQQDSIISYDNFRSSFLYLTEKINTIEGLTKICQQYNVIIVGSDQIWNPSQHNKKVYFLDFNLPIKTKRVSYAPCCTVNVIADENRTNLEKALRKFDCLSVRNITTYEFVYDLIGKKNPVVLDPTFLWDFKELIEEKKNNLKYILVYIIGNELEKKSNIAISKLKEMYGNIPVYAIVIGATAGVISVKWVDKVIYDASPKNWLNYIKNAEFLFTDSFHGVIFAMKFRVKFTAYYFEKIRASRFLDLKQRYKLDNFIIDSYSNLKYISDKEFNQKMDEVFEINKGLIKESCSFLKGSLLL